MNTEQSPEVIVPDADAKQPRGWLGPLNRRSFLRRAGLASAALPAAGGLIISACYEDPTGGKAALPAQIPTGGISAPAVPAAAAHDMDGDHEKGVKQFLANITTPNTKGKGGIPLEPKIEGDTKVFNLTLTNIEWETTPGNMEKARAYNGMVPGPEIRATEGDKVKIVVKNELEESTAVHWHGVIIENKLDGVPFITQPPIKPGETYTYEMTLRNSGTHMYHSHHNAMEQTNRGLLGAFIIEPKDPAKRYLATHNVTKEYTMVLNDTFLGFTLNGKGFPATEALTAKKGEKILIRYMNEGEMAHPMHLHGIPMRVVAIDGYPLDSPYFCDTVSVAPGNRYDTIVDCTEAGAWAFHCHILSHAEARTGMFGMVTALVVA